MNTRLDSFFLNVIGLDVVKTKWRFNFKALFSITCLLSSFTCSVLKIGKENNDGFGINVMASFVTFLVAVKMLSLVYFSKDINELAQLITNDLNLHITDNRRHTDARNGAINKAKQLIIVLFIGLSVTVIAYCFGPMLFSSNLHLPMESLGSPLPNDSLLHFWIDYAFQIWIQTICLLVTGGFDGMLLMFLLQATTHLDIMLERLDALKYKGDQKNGVLVEQISQGESIELYHNLIRIHLFQIDIVKFIRKLQSIFWIHLLFQYFSSVGIVCTSIYNSDKDSAVHMAFLLISAILQIYMFCWYGQLIKDKSDDISSYLYNCGWETSSTPVSGTVLTALICSQRPLYITVGPAHIDLQGFLQVIKMVYSLYTLLQKVDFTKDEMQ